MVPSKGVEPSRCYPHGPEPCASASSATTAHLAPCGSGCGGRRRSGGEEWGGWWRRARGNGMGGSGFQGGQITRLAGDRAGLVCDAWTSGRPQGAVQFGNEKPSSVAILPPADNASVFRSWQLSVKFRSGRYGESRKRFSVLAVFGF